MMSCGYFRIGRGSGELDETMMVAAGVDTGCLPDSGDKYNENT